MFMRKDEPYKVARVETGQQPGTAVGVYAYTAAEMGIPTVGLGNNLERLEHMKPETAEQLAAALVRAAKVARGEIRRWPPIPSESESLPTPESESARR